MFKAWVHMCTEEFQYGICDKGNSILGFRKASDVKLTMLCIGETVDRLITRWHTLEIWSINDVAQNSEASITHYQSFSKELFHTTGSEDKKLFQSKLFVLGWMMNVPYKKCVWVKMIYFTAKCEQIRMFISPVNTETTMGNPDTKWGTWRSWMGRARAILPGRDECPGQDRQLRPWMKTL